MIESLLTIQRCITVRGPTNVFDNNQQVPLSAMKEEQLHETEGEEEEGDEAAVEAGPI